MNDMCTMENLDYYLAIRIFFKIYLYCLIIAASLLLRLLFFFCIWVLEIVFVLHVAIPAFPVFLMLLFCRYLYSLHPMVIVVIDGDINLGHRITHDCILCQGNYT